MQFIVNILPLSIVVLTSVICLVLLVWAVASAPWYKFLDSESSHVFLAAVVAVLFLWLIRANVIGDVSFHLLSSSILYLMFGWQFAFIVIVVVQGVLVFSSGLDLTIIPLNTLILAGVPIFITHWMLVLALRHLPHNFFIYIFVNCFFAGAISIAISALLGFSIFYLFASESAFHQLREFLPLVLLMSFPEGALTTILMSGLVAYKPQWVGSFHDKTYITGK